MTQAAISGLKSNVDHPDTMGRNTTAATKNHRDTMYASERRKVKARLYTLGFKTQKNRLTADNAMVDMDAYVKK